MCASENILKTPFMLTIQAALNIFISVNFENMKIFEGGAQEFINLLFTFSQRFALLHDNNVVLNLFAL